MKERDNLEALRHILLNGAVKMAASLRDMEKELRQMSTQLNAYIVKLQGGKRW